MQRTLLIICVAVCALSVRGADNEAQIRARQSLEQKLQELQSHPPVVTAPAPQQTAPTAPAPKPSKVKPARVPATPETKFAAPPSTADIDADNKARDAMRQRLEAQPPSATTRPQPPATTALPTPRQQPRIVEPTPAPVTPAEAPPVATSTPEPTPAPVVTSPAPVVTQRTRPVPADPEAIAKAREAMRLKMNEVVNSEPPPAMTPALVQPSPQPEPRMAAQPAPVARPNPDANMAANQQPKVAVKPKPQKPREEVRRSFEFRPLEGPPSSLNASKQEQLNELLRKYRADEISPEEYHSQRAKLVGEP